jgi:hypothetical protein
VRRHAACRVRPLAAIGAACGGCFCHQSRLGGLARQAAAGASWLLEDRPRTKVLHDLREAAATFLVVVGLSTETLGTNLSWKRREVVERYVNLAAIFSCYTIYSQRKSGSR